MVNFVTTADQKTAAAHAVRRLGYRTLSEFLREKMQQAIKDADKAATGAAG